MEWLWLLLGFVIVAAIVAALVWRPIRTAGREVQAARARELYRLTREQLEALFLDAAAATGKPRGLRWVDVALEREIELARDRQSGQLVGLVGATIRFEAVEGGPMEGVEAVGNLRSASALFAFVKGRWTTNGRTVFNLSPSETLVHFAGQYEPIPARELR